MDFDQYKEKLSGIFNHSARTEEQIEDAIQTILNSDDTVLSSFDAKLELMVDLLLESGDSSLSENNETSEVVNDSRHFSTNFRQFVDSEQEFLEEGAVGFTTNNAQISNQDYLSLSNTFPDICPNFVDDLFRTHSLLNMHQLAIEISNMDYRRKEIDPLDLCNNLMQIIPDADPEYLKNQARVLAKKPLQCHEEFIQDAIEKKNYPKMQDYLIRKEKSDAVSIYTKNFSVGTYLEYVTDPVEKFSDPERKGVDLNDRTFVLNFLCNQYPYLRQHDIKTIFSSQGNRLTRTRNKLSLLPKAFRTPRKPLELDECFNVDLVQEVVFLMHEKDIRQCLKMRSDKYREAFEEAKKFGLLMTCCCCYNDELIPEECLFCNKECSFCKQCVKTGAENVIGEGGTRFPCLTDCPSEFTYVTLEMVLDKKVFQRLCERKQIEEIKSANIDGLETCPFCDFSMVMSDGDKIFKCGNLECMMESCRECRHISHVPLRCSEIEYDEDVKMRTYIEDKMTEALVRTCHSCFRKFFKESGCNKMTCVCGAKMCYHCGQAILAISEEAAYSHFNGTGCSLFTEEDLDQFHLNKVLQAARVAKNDLGVTQNPKILKFDPTKDLVK